MTGQAVGIDPMKLRRLYERERRRFVELRPRSTAAFERARSSMAGGVPMSWMRAFYDTPPVYAAEGRGSRFRDIDGIEYVDFNIADMSMFCGFSPPAVVRAVRERIASGSQFMIPTEDSLWVAEELASRWGLPKWQFTLSASQANTEAVRLARATTGRDRVLIFAGKYLGHFDEVLVDLSEGRLVAEERGLPRSVTERTSVVQFNDLEAVREALSRRDIALVITEPAFTNVVGLLLPDDGFHLGLRAATRETGTLLAYDETHTQVFGRGGLVRAWALEPDLVTLGKSIGGGVPLGAYGMTQQIASILEVESACADGHPPVATGGTLFGNPLSMAAARAALGEVLTETAYEHTHSLGTLLATGLKEAIENAKLPWTVTQLGPRLAVTFAASRPRTARDAYVTRDLLLMHTSWVYLANRGVWDALIGAGPTCSIPSTRADVEHYLAMFSCFLEELTARECARVSISCA